MKKIIVQWLWILIAICHVGSVKAGGMAVIDAANITQTTVSAFESVKQTGKQIQQYHKQLLTYEKLLVDTTAPAAYVWSKAQQTMNKLVHYQNLFQYYTQEGGVDHYLARYRNASYYSKSNCFKFGVKCSADELKEMTRGQENSTQAQKYANDALMRGIEQHQADIAANAVELQALQVNAQTAQGRLEAIQYASQIASQQANQLLQIRALMVAHHNAENARYQAEVDQKAMWQASHEAATKRLSPVNLPTGRTWSVRDAF